ncbi:uncharacterized protein LOC5506459 [Nematostella vectensis]|uniref:uncharacterized protein LOC5506459 n=1 Tax=Nematostella vectensis TaxID=45351 RepID=UPI0020774F1D|nr:uncharacterized protein LOC5506459 [Nematostella vectensis]
MLGRKTASWQVVKCTWKAQISHDYGTSIKNQRIEAYWSIQRHRNSIFWEQLFKDLEAEGKWIQGNHLHRQCLQYVFMPLLRRELKEFVEEHNSHRIRRQKDRLTPQGIPEDLYSFPERFGFRNAGYVPRTSHLQFLREEKGLGQSLPDFLEVNFRGMATTSLTCPSEWKIVGKHMNAFLSTYFLKVNLFIIASSVKTEKLRSNNNKKFFCIVLVITTDLDFLVPFITNQ